MHAIVYEEEPMHADDSMYGQAPSPGGGYGSTGVKRPPIAYYNNETGGVVVTPPKSLFVNFGKEMDKVLQVCSTSSLALGTSNPSCALS